VIFICWVSGLDGWQAKNKMKDVVRLMIEHEFKEIQ
jgi:hypothetical protein